MISLPCITLNRYAQERAKKRHPWIFSNELADSKHLQRLEPGSLVDVLDCHGDYLGTGFTNPRSLICVRILTREREEKIDAAFFRRKIEGALKVREPLYGKGSGSEGTYRAVFGESDGLPGLVIDRFQGAWVIEPHALGMHLRRQEIAEALREFAGQEAIITRTDNRAAQLEGMEVGTELLSGAIPAGGAFAVEDGIRFPVDPLTGQKTGFFFDHRDNRTFFRMWAEGSVRAGRKLHVLDVFCHAGAWGLRALQAGASKATFVDSSAAALESVKAAAKSLGVLDKITCIEGDALDVISRMEDRTFNMIALDPPALIPNKKSIAAGSKAYRELNAHSLRLATNGGVVSTSSCSYHLEETRFEEMVAKAQGDCGREARVLHRGGLSADHPFLAGMEEGRYLKNLFLAVL
jgi:23S rRNA (cytosine1962-C5)-methyltransferase